jgi:hypothetical protein
MKGLILLMMVSFTSAVWSNDWTPRVAGEGAMVTIEMEVAAAPLPPPNSDGVGIGAKLESPIDTYREAKSLIEKGNALADRGKRILDEAEKDGKITVDIRLPVPVTNDSQSRQKANTNCSGGSCSDGKCPFQSQAEDQQPASNEPTQACCGDRKSRHILRWRR